MKKPILVAALVCLAVCSPLLAESKVSDMFHALLVTHGLGHLAPEDMAKVEDLVGDMNRTITSVARERAVTFNSAVEYFERQGYTRERVKMSRLDGKTVMIVGTLNRYATTDVPLMLGSLPDGMYFVRESPMGGIEEIVANGDAHRFFLAKWIPLR
jgi:hypothetical protein